MNAESINGSIFVIEVDTSSESKAGSMLSLLATLILGHAVLSVSKLPRPVTNGIFWQAYVDHLAVI